MYCPFLKYEGNKCSSTNQLEEDEGEDAGEEAHDGNLHDDFEDVVFVEGLVL